MYAQTSSEDTLPNKHFKYHCQLGFGSALTFASDDKDAASLLTDPQFKTETREQIPGFFFGYRFNKKFSLHIAYEGFWKVTRAAAYAGSVYDDGSTDTDWSGGILLSIFEAFGLTLPPSAPRDPGWYPVTDQISWETWGDLLSARIGYTFLENKFIRLSANAGPCLVLTTESVHINGNNIYTYNNTQYVDQRSETFDNLSQGLDIYGGVQAEFKLLKRLSILLYSNAGAPVINPSSPEQYVEVYNDKGNKRVTSASHKITSSFINAGAGIVYNFIAVK